MTERLSRGQRASDAVTRFGGSWPFVIVIAVLTFGWPLFNSGSDAWDPFPFIFFNLFLTVVSTLQSPLIMMSQNRQVERDKQAANAQAELDRELVRGLHLKLDTIAEALRAKGHLVVMPKEATEGEI